MLLAVAASALASDECAPAFERWVKFSETRVRNQRPAGNLAAESNEACIASENVRQELLRGLANVRAKCEEFSWFDQSTQQTKTMIGANESFMGSVALCRADQLTDPATKGAPASAPLAAPRQCLQVSRVAPERYLLSNRRCAESMVLAIVEMRAPSGKIACKAHTIKQKTTVATAKNVHLQLNYECTLGDSNCTKEHVATMFPECDW
jgi:hypothetical protein